MKTVAITSLLSIAGVACAAGVCFVVFDAKSREAEQELVAFRANAYEQANKQRIYPTSSGLYIVSMVAPIIAPSDRVHIDALDRKHRSYLYRREFAAWGLTRGTLVAGAVLGCWWLLKRRQTRSAIEEAT